MRRPIRPIHGVHPRVCGGSLPARPGHQPPRGPSPRVRGKLYRSRRQVVGGRSIPACAGEARHRGGTDRPSTVHPRVCGGSALDTGLMLAALGPSPRVRGKPRLVLLRAVLLRSIPACAGEAGRPVERWSSWTVHPRVCGGSGRPVLANVQVAGPSPRVRGKRGGLQQRRVKRRSIPACAGEALHRAGRAPRGGVHPRVCGGSFIVDIYVRNGNGPSPRVRGKRRGRALARARPGSIPACAGEAFESSRSSTRFRVHPRVCGGSVVNREDRPRPGGPSPRVRGKHDRSKNPGAPIRSIPACAGEAGTSHGGTAPGGVHPRVCGGSFILTQQAWEAIGPSPRVRGKHRIPLSTPLDDGSIPACAGEAARVFGQSWSHAVHPRVCGGSRGRFCLALRSMGPSPRVRGKPYGRLHHRY